MAVSFSTFERLKTKGVAAYKKGDFTAGKTYLVEAAECMVELAESAKSPEARRQHEEIAVELIDLAKECSRRKHEPKSARRRVSSPEGVCQDKGAGDGHGSA